MAIHAASIPRVQEIVTQAVHAMEVAAKGRGLLLNYAQGKTEVMLHLVGRGSTAAKVALNDAHNVMEWKVDEHKYQVRVVHCYKHLGTWLQQGAKSSKEVAARGSAARQSWGTLHRSFYAKKYVAVPAKMKAFASLTLSRLLYNCHTWSPVSTKVVQEWQNHIRKPLGLLARGHTLGVSPLELDVPTLCGLLHVLPPEDLLHMARLRYLSRLLRTCPAILWQMLLDNETEQHSWLQACATSLGWFRRFYSDHFAVPSTNDVRQWIPLISLDAHWKGRIKAAGQACKRFRQAEAEAVAWQKRFDASFCASGGVLPDAPPSCAERWTCNQCDKWFGSKRALAAHSARLHGYRREVKLFAV